MLQYVQLLGATEVPLQNSQQQQVIVYAVNEISSPDNAISQAQFNQFNNALALLNAFNGTYQSPMGAQILLPDSQQTGMNPIVGYREFYSSIGTTLNAGTSNAVTINNETDAISYAVNNAGVLYLYALTPGTQHQIIYGLFDSSSSVYSATQAFGLPVENGTLGNPFGILSSSSASDGVVTNSSYINAINSLGNQRADVIVVLNTDPGIQSVLETYVTVQSSTDYRNEGIGIVSGPISEYYTTTIQNVTALQGSPGAKRMMYIYPTAAFMYDSILNTTITVDGTYLAAGVAGILTSHDSAEPLTHKVLAGFIDVAVHLDNLTANSIAQNGICIIENNPTYGIRVRDQLTCDPSTPETQEISVVRQLDFTAQTLRDLMDANIIATKITQSTIGVVTSLTTTAMQSLENSGIIYGYKNIVARINPNDPRQIDLSVTVRPAYPCKYVQITISVTSSLSGLS